MLAKKGRLLVFLSYSVDKVSLTWRQKIVKAEVHLKSDLEYKGGGIVSANIIVSEITRGRNNIQLKPCKSMEVKESKSRLIVKVKVYYL